MAVLDVICVSLALASLFLSVHIFILSFSPKLTFSQFSKVILRSLSICDILLSLVYLTHPLLGDSLFESELFCTINGTIDVIAILSSVCWTAAINCFNASLVLRKGYREVYVGRRTGWMLHLLCWGVPIVFGAICLTQDVIAPSSNWCFITADRPDLRFFFLYLEVLVVFALSLILGLLAALRIRRIQKAAQKAALGGTRMTSSLLTQFHLVIVCLIYVIVWAPITVTRVLEALGSVPPPALSTASRITCNGRGVLDYTTYLGLQKLRKWSARRRFDRVNDIPQPKSSHTLRTAQRDLMRMTVHQCELSTGGARKEVSQASVHSLPARRTALDGPVEPSF
eukprot:gnl/Dysnectes_brevis/6682_a10554_415.p1 GENE.gnl/Dysnectes_brevis/6682_a10554_415~~gnl/Dysnectes_brevis/6682_a10554_415.p1  ORF type:complete len:351 (-),score=42.94 gnl/Dysnectes_brevis/6682_a10554_415:319-1338(-)